MDGMHDLGGKQGFGAVSREANEPVFHARWESRVFGMNLVGAGGAARNVDHFRHAVERIDPVAYLTHGYYGRWLGGLETMMVEAGVLDTRRDHAARDRTRCASGRSHCVATGVADPIVSTIRPRSTATSGRSNR